MECDIEIGITGTTYYYKKGTKVLHREAGPAVEFSSGAQIWYIDGKRHRVGGPASDFGNSWFWYINGKLHRENGPAVELEDGGKQWYINGERLSPEKEDVLNKWWDNKNGI